MFVAKNEEMILVAKLVLCMHLDIRFRNGWRTTMKLRETIPNMSFGSKLVDWASSLQKTKKWFRWQKLVLCMTPDTRFRNRWRAATKLCETTPNMSFGPKVVDWACSLWKTKKWFWWQKLVLYMQPLPIFGIGDVRQRNCAKPHQTWVLDLN
jgi:hypothetical protein